MNLKKENEMTKVLKARLWRRGEDGRAELEPEPREFVIETLPDKEFLGYDAAGNFWQMMMNEQWRHITRDWNDWADQVSP